MSQLTTRLHLPQPCAESWAAMTPAHGGRHCAACQKTVIDFTWYTDAELLAFFRQAGSANACGRFRASQLARPLRPAAPPASPAPRWQAWLAAALALWSLRAEAASSATAPTPPRSAHHPRRQPVPASPTRQVAKRLVSGVVRDAATQEALPHVRVSVLGSALATQTDANGYFRLRVPARHRPHAARTLTLHRHGYLPQTARVPLAARAAGALHLALTASAVARPTKRSSDDYHLSGAPRLYLVEADTGWSPAPAQQPHPARRQPRAFYRWLTQLFRTKTSL